MTDTKDPKDPKKDLWKANLLELFHNYFIGISHLECTNENCPIVDNWDAIEEKQSKKGLCALVKNTSTDFLVAKIVDKKINGLEQLTEVTIELRDEARYLVRTPAEKEKLLANLPKEQKEKLQFRKPEEVVYFINNSNFGENLMGAEDYLDEMWEIKNQIAWDREASRKKIINWVEQKPDPNDKSKKIEEFKGDYIYYIHNPDITNEIKKHEVFQTQNTKEREQLHADYEKLFSEIRRVYGIRHLTSKKEDRQNNPEIELNEAQFIALEHRKKRIREKSIKDAENKVFCRGTHTLTYGTAPEQREEKVAEVKQLEEIKDEPMEEEKLEIYERKH